MPKVPNDRIELLLGYKRMYEEALKAFYGGPPPPLRKPLAIEIAAMRVRLQAYEDRLKEKSHG